MGSIKKMLLVLEDEYISTHLIHHFSPQHFEFYQTSSGVEALDIYKKHKPTIVIINLVLSETDGMEVCQKIRELSPHFPPYIVIISNYPEEYTEVAAFQNGADDYVRKPVRIRAFLKRLQVAWQRINQDINPPNILHVDNYFSINSSSYIITIQEDHIQLPRKEFRLLEYLARNPYQVISRETLINEIWGKSVIVNERTVDVHIAKVRRIIGDHFIETVKGIGYRFVIPEGNG